MTKSSNLADFAGTDFVTPIEGTWTPTLANDETLTVYGTPHFVKIGKLVVITANFSFPSSSDTGTAIVDGLPYAPIAAGTNSEYAMALGECSYGSFITVAIHSGVSGFVFRPNGGSSTSYQTLASDNFRGVCSYFTDE